MNRDISKIPVSQLREAASAWREASRPRGWFGGGGNMSTFDRIDDMIAEIERLRTTSKAEEPASS